MKYLWKVELLKIAWIGLLIEIIIFNFIKPFIIDFEVAAICLIGINILFVAIGISKYGKKNEGIILLCIYSKNPSYVLGRICT